MTKCWLYALVAVSLLSACSDPSNIIHESSEKSESSLQIDNCTLASPCAGQKGIALWYDQATIVGEEAFTIELSVPQGTQIVSAILSGEQMNMGYIPVFFKQNLDMRYSAQAMVGLCTQALMHWRLTVTMLDVNSKKYEQVFPLYVSQ
ncbi:hypothetical protein PSECIP111951_01783 [Pseudoalteromonas holothuriae]|uniref:Lipoprotein n=1 Tax=Pseudoalteromonas holothuriae TaxID=2963714 RepID=A0ABM9GHZ0_9GAMM|nr:hypothetical protein [Pseudoalteromonas sp. CIP111951]CAH9058009.1 hypothetical protein PSECIP111951_01783 [Pseudoalteromonas sp. CIP111951]